MSLNVKRLFDIFVKKNDIGTTICQNLKPTDDLFITTNSMEEKKVTVDGLNINYLRTGKGECVVLLLPGMLGSLWSHFNSQIENLDNQKLTIIAWDPPGYGKSVPPSKTFPKNFYEEDARLAYNLMKTLGYEKFSIMGYSGGATTALILAAIYPENIQKMIVIAPHAYITPAVMEMLEEMRDINTWSKRDRIAGLEICGERYFKDTLNSCVDTLRDIFENNDGDICKRHLNNIKCPTLIVYGERDKLVPREQPDYLQANIINSKLITFRGSTHCPHLKYPDEFNDLAHKFLLGQRP